ncbi:MAG: LCP family protein [Candidatus Kerfeldbacteria bacterium]|nr:LCP family protein [Candidatus Kerfeldbacteria bacterium]
MRKFLVRFGIFLVIILLLAGFVALGLYVDAPDRYNVLIIGSDQRDTERARSDVLMVFSIPKDPRDQTSLLTVPRDTRVEVPGYGTQKITHAYALGDRPEGSVLGNRDLVVQTVSTFLDIPIHATLEFTFESFKSIIDAEGGIRTAEGLLSGDDALALVRDRYREGGDFARTEDQRGIFLQLFQTIHSLKDIQRFQRYIAASNQAAVRYEPGPTIQFGFAAGIRRYGRIAIGDVRTEVVPGSGQSIYTPEFDKDLSYWVPNDQRLRELVTELFR